MSEKYKPQVGDRVRLTYEGVYDGGADSEGVSVGGGTKFYVGHALDAALTIEKIEPPIEIFGPGDVVRHKGSGGHIYSIGKDGYLDHRSGRWDTVDKEPFTSEEYERIVL